MNTHSEKKKIILTGGHAGTTAYAFLQSLENSYPGKYDTFFIGSVLAIEGKNLPTSESQILSKLGCKFISIDAGRIQRNFTFWTIPSLVKIPLGFIQTIHIIRKVKPEVILSFGGYAAFPVVLVGKLFGVPIVIHEQTAAAGRSNIFCSRFAKVVAISRESSSEHFKFSKVFLCGNPIPNEWLNIRPKLKISSNCTIFVTGGSRGSVSVNTTIEKALPYLLSNFRVIHQVGRDNINYFLNVKKRISYNRDNYKPYSFLPPEEYSKLVKESDIIISRSGANSVSLFTWSRRPAIYVPLPFSYLDEQFKNAKIIADSGAAVIIKQDQFNVKNLKINLKLVIKNWRKMVKADTEYYRQLDKNASKNLVDLVLEYIK